MNKNIGKRLGRRGKTMLAILIAVMFVSIATAALIPHFGVIKTTATVDKQAVQLSADGSTWLSYNAAIEHPIPDAAPSETYCFKQWIRNSASVPVDVTFTNNDPADESIITTYTVQTTDDNTNWGDNEVVAFPIASGITLDELFDDAGLSYTYTVLDGGQWDGASPVIAVIDIDDGRHIILYPGWGTRTGSHSLQFSDTVATCTADSGNVVVDFTIYTSDFQGGAQWSSNNQYGNWNYLKASGSSTGGPLPLTGTEVVTRVAIQHQAANTGETDKLDSLTIDGTTNNFAITEGTPFTMQSGQLLSFYICHKFALKIREGTYPLVTTVDAIEST